MWEWKAILFGASNRSEAMKKSYSAAGRMDGCAAAVFDRVGGRATQHTDWKPRSRSLIMLGRRVLRAVPVQRIAGGNASPGRLALNHLNCIWLFSFMLSVEVIVYLYKQQMCMGFLSDTACDRSWHLLLLLLCHMGKCLYMIHRHWKCNLFNIKNV